MSVAESTESITERFPGALAELKARKRAEWEAWHELLTSHPTEHPHHLTLILEQGVRVQVDCPGKEHCSLSYKNPYAPEGHKCGLQVEVEEIGSEFLELAFGPAFTPATNPFPIGFRWSGGMAEDDPPEVEWWPLREAVTEEA